MKELVPITLKTLPKATKQEVYDYIAVNLLTQMSKSLSATEECAYRGLNGESCAGGFVISDDEYEYEMELYSWDELVKHRKVPKDHDNLVSGMQMIHDSYDPPEWHKQLSNLALFKSLNTEAIKDFLN